VNGEGRDAGIRLSKILAANKNTNRITRVLDLVYGFDGIKECG